MRMCEVAVQKTETDRLETDHTDHQNKPGITATSIIYESSHDIECVLIKIWLWLKRECLPLLQPSIIQKLICQSC